MARLNISIPEDLVPLIEEYMKAEMLTSKTGAALRLLVQGYKWSKVKQHIVERVVTEAITGSSNPEGQKKILTEILSMPEVPPSSDADDDENFDYSNFSNHNDLVNDLMSNK